MVEYDRNQQSELSGRQPLRICVAGVGGAGSNVLDRITMDRTVEATLVSFQTDVRVLHHSTSPRKIQLGTELMRGVGAGGDPDLGREAAMFSKEEIRNAVDGHDMVFISVGLGGGTGSGAAPVIAEIAKSTGALVLVFAAVPFGFEGRRRHQQATDALDRLQKCADALILFDNSRMGELVLPKDGIQKAFSQADQLIAQSVRAVAGMVGAPSIVKLGLDDLVSALRTNEGRCLFGFGEAKGQNRGVDALKKALKSPLINQGQLLQSAKNLLVHIVGGESLTLAEVEVVMKQLGRHVPDETQILFGIGVEPKLGESVTVTLVSSLSATELATRHLVEAEPEQRREAPARLPVARAVAPPLTPLVEEEEVEEEDSATQLFAAPEPAPAPQPKRPSVAMQAAIAAVAPPPAELFAPAPQVPVSAPQAPAAAPIPEPVPAPPVQAIAALPEPEIEPEPEMEAVEVQAAPTPAPIPPVQAVAAPAPRPRAQPAPEPEPEPVAEVFPEEEAAHDEEPAWDEAESAEQVVYMASEIETIDEPEEEAFEPTPAPVPAAPMPREKGFKLSSVLDSMSQPEPVAVAKAVTAPVVDEIFIETENRTPVIRPIAETAPVPLPRPVARPVPVAAAAPVEHMPVSRVETAVEAEGSDLFGSSPAPVLPSAGNVSKKAAPAPAEQQTFRLGGNEDRGRFKDTEPALVQGEDLDTPTWMRLRRRVAR
ncbi:MAG: Cell division protein FtsZ [Verrucomicrobiaceae bacterium]|nr:Cell division protein FtsZ [Verrucomicrobiaceae bacterium]